MKKLYESQEHQLICPIGHTQTHQYHAASPEDLFSIPHLTIDFITFHSSAISSLEANSTDLSFYKQFLYKWTFC